MTNRNAGYSKRTLRRREILKWAGGASIASALGTAARVTASGTGMHNPAGHVLHDNIYATTDPVTADPVATDRIALDVIDGFRRENRLRTLTESGRPAKYLDLAADLGLGIADRSRIHLETVTLPRFSGSAA
jgi:hypothetical protein